jgi:hypothetical protein
MPRTKCVPADRVGVCSDVSSREFDGEWVLLDLRNGAYFGLDELGGAIWDNLVKGRSPAEIAASLSATYSVTEDVLLRDVLVLVDDLLDRELVRILE